MTTQINTILPINTTTFNNQEINAVSAKALYEALGLSLANYAAWTDTNIINNKYYTENEDWVVFMASMNTYGGRPSQDFMLTIPLAKKLAMMTRSAKGEEVRDYFLECEKKALASFKMPSTLPEALRAYANEVEAKEKAELAYKMAQPAISFHEAVSNSNKCISISDFAKFVNVGPNILFRKLREGKILIDRPRTLKHNSPYQTYIDREYFNVVETEKSGFLFSTTLITGKGQTWLTEWLKKQ